MVFLFPFAVVCTVVSFCSSGGSVDASILQGVARSGHLLQRCGCIIDGGFFRLMLEGQENKDGFFWNKKKWFLNPWRLIEITLYIYIFTYTYTYTYTYIYICINLQIQSTIDSYRFKLWSFCWFTPGCVENLPGCSICSSIFSKDFFDGNLEADDQPGCNLVKI